MIEPSNQKVVTASLQPCSNGEYVVYIRYGEGSRKHIPVSGLNEALDLVRHIMVEGVKP